MITVTFQEAIERFADLLELVERGEKVTVVRDGLPVCEIVPSGMADVQAIAAAG